VAIFANVDPMNTNQVARITDGMPKFIDPKTHAVLDYTTAAALLAMGFKLRNQHRRASNFAFMNAATVAASSMLTDYPGGLLKRMSFQAHGLMDVLQAAVMAAGPALMGFGRDREAQLFYAQAAMEAGVIAATDWQSSSSSPASFA
jgi:hypothetical protein